METSRRFLSRWSVSLCVMGLLTTATLKGEEVDQTPTHKQVATISLSQGGADATLNTFCLGDDGNIYAAYGGEKRLIIRENGRAKVKMVNEPTEIRVFGPDGKHLNSWKVDMFPQTLNLGPDGSLYAAGMGKMIKLNPKTGKVLITTRTPHADAIEGQSEKILKRYAASYQRSIDSMKQRLGQAKQQIETLSAKKDLTAQEKQQLTQAKQLIPVYEKNIKSLGERQKSQGALILRNKLKVTGLAVTEKDVFVACPAVEGYGYDIWRMNHEYKESKAIVTGLRGCCGNMDIQCCNGSIYVAENSRHRVCRYDRDGKLLTSFGQRDRQGTMPDGFGSCCNPMNLRFGPNGDVYTAESTLGRIKRFTADGKFVSVIGKVELVPGCKHVAIAVSKNGDKVYMLDITRTQLAVLTKQ